MYAGRHVKGLEDSGPSTDRPISARPRPISRPQRQRTLPPSALNQPSGVQAADRAAASVPRQLTADLPHVVALPMPSPESDTLPLQQMVEGLSSAPTSVLIAVFGSLHAAALKRGVLLTPHDQLARRGRSSVNHNMIPNVCSACEGVGSWGDHGSMDDRVCCNTCITVVHQSFSCSSSDPSSLDLNGWQCAECWAGEEMCLVSD